MVEGMDEDTRKEYEELKQILDELRALRAALDQLASDLNLYSAEAGDLDSADRFLAELNSLLEANKITHRGTL